MSVMHASHIFFILGLSLSASAMAQTPADVADLVGAKGAGGETQLKARGYRFVRIETGDDRKWTFWWNGDRRQCLSVVTYDGRYQAITESPAPDCGESASAPGSHGGAPHRPDIGYARPRPDRVAPSYAADDSPKRTIGFNSAWSALAMGSGPAWPTAMAGLGTPTKSATAMAIASK